MWLSLAWVYGYLYGLWTVSLKSHILVYIVCSNNTSLFELFIGQPLKPLQTSVTFIYKPSFQTSRTFLCSAYYVLVLQLFVHVFPELNFVPRRKHVLNNIILVSFTFHACCNITFMLFNNFSPCFSPEKIYVCNFQIEYYLRQTYVCIFVHHLTNN